MSNKHRPDLATHVLNNLRTGAAKDLSDEIAATVDAVRHANKQGTVTLVLTIRPEGEGMYSIEDQIKSTQPKLPRGKTMFWGTPEGNLVTRDPNQGELELKQVSTADAPTPLKQVS